MRVEVRGAEVHYSSDRLLTPAVLHAKYRPVGPAQLHEPGTLPYWLTERYCLYTVWRERVYRCDIHHPRWKLQNAELEISRNTMAQAAGIRLPETRPLLHLAKRQDVLIWPLRTLPS